MKRLSPRHELLTRVTAAGSQKRAAKDLGVTASYLHDLLNGRRTFSARILAKLGLETVVVKKGAAA